MSTEKPNIAFVVAHPDDVAFYMGGTALLLKDAYKLHVIVASKGERGYPWKGTGLPPPNQDVANRRAGEEAAACKLLDAELTFLGEMDGEIYASPEVCDRTAKMLADLKPVALITMGPLQKPDHAAAWGIAWKAIHLADLFWHMEFYMTILAGDDRHCPTPNVYVNISAVWEKKLELVRCHGEHGVEWSEILTRYNRAVGAQAWCDYAESFATALPLTAVRWKRRAGSILMNLPVEPGRTQ